MRFYIRKYVFVYIGYEARALSIWLRLDFRYNIKMVYGVRDYMDEDDACYCVLSGFKLVNKDHK